jgi:hypothetical protein
MGVVFRNGRPFGAAKEDITIVTNFEDLTNLPNKETNHLYVTTSDNTEYYWNVENREFVPLSATFNIAADENEIVIGDGEGEVKPHSFWFAEATGVPDSLSKLKTTSTAIEIGSTASVPENYWDNDKNNAKFFMSGSPLL